MHDLAVRMPDTAEAQREAASILDTARAITVTTVQEHHAALEAQKECRRREVFWTEHFEPARAALDQSKKELLAARDRIVRPFAEAREIIGSTARAWKVQQEEKARQEERRIAALARAAEEERRLAEALAAEAAGDAEEAEAILDEKPLAPVIHIQPQVAKVEGVSTRTSYSAEVTDMEALIRFVAANPQFINLLLPNGPALNALARAQRESLNLPGVRVRKIVTEAFRR